MMVDSNFRTCVGEILALWQGNNSSYTRKLNSPAFLLAAFFGIGCGSVTHRSLSRPGSDGILRQVRRMCRFSKA